MGELLPVDLDLTRMRHGTELLKRGFAKMQKGGVIMDVVNAEQARIAEEAGAVAVMALERVPADIRAAGGVARAADPLKVQEILDAVSIPVMAKARIGHTAEALMWQTMGVDMIDESEVLTPASPFHHIDKRQFTIPFVCGATNLGEAVRRIAEGAAMIRTKGEAGTGNVIEAVRHFNLIDGMIKQLDLLTPEEFEGVVNTYAAPFAKLESEVRSPWPSDPPKDTDIVFGGKKLGEWEREIHRILAEIQKIKRLPVVNFAAGGIATPADASLMMQLGCDGIFVGSGIFKSENPKKMAEAIVEAVAHYDEPEVIASASRGLGQAMKGLDIDEIPPENILAGRGL